MLGCSHVQQMSWLQTPQLSCLQYFRLPVHVTGPHIPLNEITLGPIPGPWSRTLVPARSPWPQVPSPGTWSPVPGPRSLVPGPWYRFPVLVPCPGPMVPKSMVPGPKWARSKWSPNGVSKKRCFALEWFPKLRLEGFLRPNWIVWYPRGIWACQFPTQLFQKTGSKGISFIWGILGGPPCISRWWALIF